MQKLHVDGLQIHRGELVGMTEEKKSLQPWLGKEREIQIFLSELADYLFGYNRQLQHQSRAWVSLCHIWKAFPYLCSVRSPRS